MEIINLKNVLFNQSNIVDQLRNNLKSQGYAFVKLPKYIITPSLIDNVKLFFNNDTNYKEQFFREPIFGWFEVEHKEVFRFRTGEKLKLQQFPNEIEEDMQKVSGYLDLLMPKLACILFPGVDQKLNLPFYQWGLIDVVHYNNKVNRKDNLNIVEHYDPGLLSLSLFSTEPGFQFKNSNGEWIDPPMGDRIGMLWAGHAIKLYDPSYPEGSHRVTTSLNPRFSMWYEMPTFDQERNDMLNGQYKGYDYEIELMEKTGYKPVRDDNGNITNYISNNNIMVGYKALESVTTGSNKTAMGSHALTFSTNAGDNIGIGYEALKN